MRDARLDLRIAVRIVIDRVELRDRIQHLAPRGLGDPRWIAEIQHRCAPGAKPDALITRWQESAGPQAREQRLIGVDGVSLRQQDHERRQILIDAPKPVAEPRAHARTARLLKTGLNERDGRVVVDRLRVHRLDDGDVVDDLRGVGQQLAHPRAALAVPGERER